MIAVMLALALGAEDFDLSAALKEQRDIVCGDTLACWKRKTLTLDTTIEAALLIMGSQKLRLEFAATEITLWKTKANDYSQSLEGLKPVLLAPTVQSSWLQSPTLWFGVGFVTAAAMAIGIFAVAKNIEKNTQ